MPQVMPLVERGRGAAGQGVDRGGADEAGALTSPGGPCIDRVELPKLHPLEGGLLARSRTALPAQMEPLCVVRATPVERLDLVRPPIRHLGGTDGWQLLWVAAHSSPRSIAAATHPAATSRLDLIIHPPSSGRPGSCRPRTAQCGDGPGRRHPAEHASVQRPPHCLAALPRSCTHAHTTRTHARTHTHTHTRTHTHARTHTRTHTHTQALEVALARLAQGQASILSLESDIKNAEVSSRRE